MQYDCANVHFTVQYAYLREGREYFLLLQNQKIFPNNSHEHKNKDKQYLFQTDFSFLKAMRRGRISFPKRKIRSTPICKCTLFFQFSQNISKSNLKLPFFYYFDRDSSKCMRDERSWRSWKVVKPIRKPMSNTQW